MRTTERVVLWVGLIVALSTSGSSVSAITTTETQFLTDPPLIIAGFERASATNNKSFIQLYNTGSTPINLNDWVVTSSSSSQPLLTPTTGILAPKHHVVASINGAVVGTVDAPSLLTLTRPIMSTETIKIAPATEGMYKSSEIVQAVKTTNPNDVWLRRLTTTGYSTAAAPFDELGSASLAQLSIMNDGLYVAPPAPVLTIVEVYAYASSCAPNDVSVLCGDYVKLYNPTDAVQSLDDLVLRTDSNSSSSTSSNTFTLEGEVSPRSYLLVHRTDNGDRISLTNSGGYVWLADVFATMRYDATITQYGSTSSDHQGWSYALFDNTWQWTMTPQPVADNLLTLPPPVIEAPKPCPAGQYRNPDTNRCRTIEEAVNALATCPEGQYRNPETNRCRSAAATVSSTLTPCGEGQERNPATNRCRSIASAVAELMPCDEGYERNPATNRCRKVLGTSTSTPSLTQAAETAPTSPTALLSNPYAIAAVIGLGGVGYGLYEWRSEIGSGFKRLAAKLGRK